MNCLIYALHPINLVINSHFIFTVVFNTDFINKGNFESGFLFAVYEDITYIIFHFGNKWIIQIRYKQIYYASNELIQQSTAEETNSEITGGPLISYKNLKKAALILRSFNNKVRQQMLGIINEHGSTTVTELYIKMRKEQSVASQHLAILR